MGLFDFFTQEIAIDLGTANTLIIHNDKVVVDEPSIVAIERGSGKVIAVGKRAMQMHGKTHEEIKTVTADGVEINSWFLPASLSEEANQQSAESPVVLFLHGNAENISTHIGLSLIHI